MDYQAIDYTREEIRLLTFTLGPSPMSSVDGAESHVDNTLNDIIHCQLEHVSPQDGTPSVKSNGDSDSLISQLNWSDFDECPPRQGIVNAWRWSWGDYVALSYCWGDLREKSNIYLNGHKTAISANLEAALCVLRDKQPTRTGYKVWVDALCINQQDIEERGREVKRMRPIYKEAREVFIWLGVEADESDKALRLIRVLSESYRTGQDRALGIALRQEPGLLGKGPWMALSQLLDRPYWDRLWVLQEIALGGDRTFILCAQQVVTWEELYDATYMFGLHNFDVMFSLIDQERKDAGLPPSGLKRNKIIHIKEEQRVQAGKSSAHTMCMLDLGRRSLATDPRDKVYGLLGMMETSVANNIIPNYSSTVHEVFFSFAKAMISANMNHYRLYSGRSTYYATNGSKPVFHFDDNAQSLLCDGLQVDIVDGLGENYYEDSAAFNIRDNLVQPKSISNAYGTESALKEALWQTLVGGRDQQGRRAPSNYRCLLERAPTEDEESPSQTRGARAFNRFITQSSELQIAGRNLRSYFATATTGDTESLRYPQEQMFRILRTRRLMVTSKGYPGLVPHETQQGDLICLLFGCNVPLVIRALDDNRYKIVGGIYVHGVMEGEAMEWLNQKAFHVRTFTLC